MNDKIVNVFLIFLLFSMMPIAQATVSESETLIEAVRWQLDGTDINAKNERTRLNLEAKLNDALIKLDQAKFCDSIGKLNDFNVKITDLSTPNRKGKYAIEAGEALNLIGGANDAITSLRVLDPECLL